MNDEQEQPLFHSSYAQVLHDLAAKMARAIPEHNRTNTPKVSAISVVFVLPEFGDLELTVDLSAEEIANNE